MQSVHRQLQKVGSKLRSVEFAHSPSGKVVRTPAGYDAFVPNPLPPELDLARVITPLVTAQHHLGELAGVGRTLTNPYLLQRPFMRREAVSSSAMEGTVTTLSELFAYEAAGERDAVASDAREVHNYVLALEHAFNSLGQIPICGRLIREVHEILLRGISRDRGAVKRPGEFRTDPAWTGARLIHEARFVFAPPDQVPSAFADLERFVASLTSNSLPDLIKASLIHYQFEAIHPFHDGNGRVGRLLIPLFLCSAGLLPQPLLFISPYLERHRDEYITRLYDVSRTGAWEEWIEFFLIGVAEQSMDFIFRSRKLLDLQATYRERFHRARASALLTRLVDIAFERPVISIPQVAAALNITYNSAKNNVERMVDERILTPLSKEHTPRLFMASEVFEIIYRPVEELAKPPTA